MFTSIRALRFGDCDPSGIAYFPACLDMLVGVTEQFFEQAGLPWPEMMRRHGIGLPTVSLNLAFLHPGLHGDLLHFTLALTRIGHSSLDLSHDVGNGERILWRAQQRLVATSLKTHKSTPWPDAFRAALAKHLER